MPRQEYIPRGQPDPHRDHIANSGGVSSQSANLDFVSPVPDLELFATQAAGAIRFARSLPPAAWVGIGVVAYLVFSRR